MSTAKDDRERVRLYLARRQDIAAKTASVVEEKTEIERIDPLDGVDPSVYEQVEEEFYREQGRFKYIGSDGRVRWLTEAQIENRKARRKTTKRSSRYYGPSTMTDQRKMVRWGFNIGAVVLALFIVWLLVL